MFLNIKRLNKYFFNYFINYYFLKIFVGFPKVMSINSSINYIIKNERSVCRFGDGEFNLIVGQGNGFQDDNAELAIKLKEILKSDLVHCDVAIPGIFSKSNMNFKAKLTWRCLIPSFYKGIYQLLNYEKDYVNSLVTRPYQDLKDKGMSKEIFTSFKLIWENKNILIVEGVGTNFGVGNDLIKNARKVKRILCPSTNAFKKYNEIKKSIEDNFESFDIVLIALGPTATVLTWELAKNNIHCIDIGHLDIEYEWYLLGAKNKIKVKYKNVNELGDNEQSSKNVCKKELLKVIS